MIKQNQCDIWLNTRPTVTLHFLFKCLRCESEYNFLLFLIAHILQAELAEQSKVCFVVWHKKTHKPPDRTRLSSLTLMLKEGEEDLCISESWSLPGGIKTDLLITSQREKKSTKENEQHVVAPHCHLDPVQLSLLWNLTPRSSLK